MSKTIEKSLFFLILVISLAMAQYEGDSCYSQRSGTIGTCSKIGSCPSAIADLRSGIRPQICSFSGTAAIVCCSQNGPAATTTTTSTTTTTPENTLSLSEETFSDSDADCPPLPPYAVNATKTGEKAWDYCIDLANKIFKCKKIVSPDGHRNRRNYCSHKVDPTAVVGGNITEKDEFPHMALLGYGDLETASWECGGTLISNRWVMTAAHCLYSRSAKSNVNFVRLGSPDVDALIVKKFLFNVIHMVENSGHVSGSGKPPQKYNDIALLKLDRAARLTKAVIPACLDIGSVDPMSRQYAIVTGWGVIKVKGSQSNVLKKVTLEEFSYADCALAHPPNIIHPQGIVNETQICYGSHNKTEDACQGDSGGPVQIQNTNVYCTYTIIGVVSSAKGCANAGIPGIYTRVAAYISWIERYVWPNE